MRCKTTSREFFWPHFSRRLLERYGLVATGRMYDGMIRQIQDVRKDTFVSRSSWARTVHCVEVDGQKVIVVYRKRLGKVGVLVTALPMEE